MVRILGLFCIVAACGGLGYRKGAELSMELRELQELRKIFLMLRSEIEYTKAPLGEAFYHIGGRTYGVYRAWLLFLAEHLEKREGQSVREIWEEAAKEKLNGLHLSKDRREVFLSIGANLGCYDREMEIGGIDLYLEQVRLAIQQMQEEIPEKRRLCRCLGVMGGIFAAVILL